MTRPLRFVLDHNIDVGVRSVFAARGIADVQTVEERGLAAGSTSDETIAVLAHEWDAVTITTDVAFSNWRRKRLVGRHVFMRCPDPDVVDVLDKHLDEILPVLKRNDNVWILVNRHKYEVKFDWDP